MTFPFAKVNNEKVTLQFTPATQADEEALAALLPEGEITDVSQLPSNIPAYLARVIPELSLNGDVILQDSAMSLGNEINLTYQLSGPLTTYAPYNYSVVAGSYLNVPLIAQSVSPNKLQDLQASVEATRGILESDDQTQLETLTRDQILGDLFYAGGLGYFAQYNGLSHIASLQSQGNHKLEFGYGSYGYEPNVDSFFGIARGIKTGGAALNILFANTVERKDGDKDARVQLRFQTGLISSALEHAVPEQMFSDPDNPTDGVSAVKALQLAAQEGQRIYQIDSSNVNAVLSQISLDASVEDEIRTYVRNGRIAIAHSNNISVPGWAGAGYILLDQETGAGSYKISGGGNGGYQDGNESESPITGIMGTLLSLLVPAANANEGNSEMINEKLLFDGFINTLIEFADYLSGFPLFGVLSNMLNIFDTTKKLAEECDLGLGVGFLLQDIVLSVFVSTRLALLLTAPVTIFAFIAFILLTTIVAAIFNAILKRQLALCRSLS